MFDEGWALDFKVFKYFFFKSFISLSQRHFNMLHINSTDGVGGDRPTCAWQRRVIVPSLARLGGLFFQAGR